MALTKSTKLQTKKNDDKKSPVNVNPVNKEFKRTRILVVILSCVLFVISVYFIYLTVTDDSNELSVSDIKWRLTTIFRLLVSLLGYLGAIFNSKRILIIAMALILGDIVLTFGLYFLSYTKLISQYNQYLDYLANIQNRTEEFVERDCDFIKVFRRRIVENLILISFYVIFVDSVINLIHCKEKLSDKQLSVKPHPKWALILLSVFHLFYSIYLFWSKTFRSDQDEQVIKKKNFGYIFLWSLMAFVSIFITIVSPFALIQLKSKDKFFLNFFISTVILSIFLGSAKFLLFVAEEFLSDNPSDDYYCNVKLTSVDSFGSILILMIINKVIISLFLMLSVEIKKEMKELETTNKN